MAKVIEGYAYTTGENLGTMRGLGGSFASGGRLESNKAFSNDLSTPIWLNHMGPTEAILLDASYTPSGMLVSVLVSDDEIAAKCNGFSVGYTIGGLRKGRLDEISILCGDDRRPGNPSCWIMHRRDATEEEVRQYEVRQLARDLDASVSRVKKAAGDLLLAVQSAEAARKKRFNAHLLRLAHTPGAMARRKAWGIPYDLGQIIREIEED